MHTREPYVYAFAFPGNFVAAWREGVPVTRYDALGAVRRLERFDLRLDPSADLFLLDGWGAGGSNVGGPFRILAASRATVLAPLQPASVDYSVTVRAASRGGQDATVELRLEVNEQQVGTVSARPQPADASVVIRQEHVGRLLRAGYNRISIVSPTTTRVAIYQIRVAPSE